MSVSQAGCFQTSEMYGTVNLILACWWIVSILLTHTNDYQNRTPRTTVLKTGQGSGKKQQKDALWMFNFCSSSCQFSVLFKIRFIWWHCQEENTLPVWLYNSHSVSTVFLLFHRAPFQTSLNKQLKQVVFLFCCNKRLQVPVSRKLSIGILCECVCGGKKNPDACLKMHWSEHCVIHRRCKKKEAQNNIALLLLQTMTFLYLS